MDHPKDHSLFGLGLPGIYTYVYIHVKILHMYRLSVYIYIYMSDFFFLVK